MKIGKIKIGLNHKPCIIAEVSGNHNKKLKNVHILSLFTLT